MTKTISLSKVQELFSKSSAIKFDNQFICAPFKLDLSDECFLKVRADKNAWPIEFYTFWNESAFLCGNVITLKAINAYDYSFELLGPMNMD